MSKANWHTDPCADLTETDQANLQAVLLVLLPVVAVLAIIFELWGGP